MIPLQASGSGLLSFLPIVAIVALFWFLVIRPQQREQKQRADMQKALARGDRVVTSGGVHGLVSGTADDVVTLEVANLSGGERVRVKVDRANISRRVQAAGESAS